ncbi:hypothetical protein [Chryseobacterium sp.]|uniref:hypothetical protein n=1 Tax=Chryseobacterium sp. TaxID=1871047 RepID=UPI00289DB4DE|nr:hypothetical protein [Chryseobacterium sp.]
MDKTTQKRNNYNIGIITVLSKKFGFTEDYIRKCLRGTRVGIMPDAIKKEYSVLVEEAKRLEKQSMQTIENLANNINPEK